MSTETLITVAYVLLILACCSSVVAAVKLIDLESYVHVPVLLLVTLGANVARRLITLAARPSEITLFFNRALFFVWPFSVLALLCIAFNRPRLLRFLVMPAAACLFAFLLLVPSWFGSGFLRPIEQLISGTSGALALGLLIARGKRAAFLSPLEMAAFFCGIAEGLAAAVGHFVPGTWWPAICVYCTLYLALLVLHVRVLWTLRHKTLSPASPPT